MNITIVSLHGTNETESPCDMNIRVALYDSLPSHRPCWNWVDHLRYSPSSTSRDRVLIGALQPPLSERLRGEAAK